MRQPPTQDVAPTPNRNENSAPIVARILSILRLRNLSVVGLRVVVVVLMAAELVGPRVYSCCNCRNHICLHDDIISKAFQGRNGRAFLFSHAMNVVMGPKEDRQLMTGLHTVADIYCHDCREVLGWKYERADEEAQKYKEGKFIFEKSKIVKENW
ncbi:hypothetical protein PR202_gb23764 [Eleusine coracana subsp. coracana]|uniref:Protein yippee-like n=1 Tax=Eleusine coracana subsp. coracana TaxID=191504 RepID=A0AAV5FK88_ELECO|nr:hypothetical protein PR202_gb23764 [Eleusine coracana subsp. coracana]